MAKEYCTTETIAKKPIKESRLNLLISRAEKSIRKGDLENMKKTFKQLEVFSKRPEALRTCHALKKAINFIQRRQELIAQAEELFDESNLVEAQEKVIEAIEKGLALEESQRLLTRIRDAMFTKMRYIGASLKDWEEGISAAKTRELMKTLKGKYSEIQEEIIQATVGVEREKFLGALDKVLGEHGEKLCQMDKIVKGASRRIRRALQLEAKKFRVDSADASKKVLADLRRDISEIPSAKVQANLKKDLEEVEKMIELALTEGAGEKALIDLKELERDINADLCLEKLSLVELTDLKKAIRKTNTFKEAVWQRLEPQQKTNILLIRDSLWIKVMIALGQRRKEESPKEEGPKEAAIQRIEVPKRRSWLSKHWQDTETYFDGHKLWKGKIDNELTQKEKEVIAHRLKEGLGLRFELTDNEAAPRLIDIGGGSGQIASELAPLFSEIVVVEQNPLRVRIIWETNQEIPNLTIVEGDFLQYAPKERFSAALLSHVLFLTPREERDELLYKTIEIIRPGGWMIIVLNSTKSRVGNHVEFRNLMQTRKNIIQGTQDTVEQRLKEWSYAIEVEEVRIVHQKQSPEEMASLISLVLRPEDRWRKREILSYVRTNLKAPRGYEFYSDQEILWVKIPVDGHY